jgi:ABC-type phosphate transport system substrate-binding protein
VEPVLEKDGAAHEAFLKEYIGKTDMALETYYRSLVFTGKASMPKTLAADAEVVAYVAKTKGAIGYVSAGAATAGVKTLEVK